MAVVGRGVVHLGLPGVLLVMIAASAGALLHTGRDTMSQGPLLHMQDLASEVAENVAALSEAGLAKTIQLTHDPRVPGVLASGDRAAGEALANSLLKDSLELDIVALFGADGTLVAVNTIGRDGRPIPRAALEGIYTADFSSRSVVQSCLRDQTVTTRMQFQTACDFTPPMLGSSGLSVAMSAPVEQAGTRVGVVSTRLNFQRVTGLLRESAYTQSGNSVYLVSDDGAFFDERINSGETPPPLPAALVLSAVSAAGEGQTDATIVRRDDQVVLGRRVPVGETVAAGGMSVLLSATNEWLTAQVRQSQALAWACLVLSIMAMAVWVLYAAARAGRTRSLIALDSERARLSLILENVGDGVLGVDPAGRVTFANSAAEELLGPPASELRECGVGGLIPAHAGTGLTEWRDEDTQMLRPAGGGFRASVVCTLMPAGGGVVTFRDQTERLAAEGRLREATRLAGRSEIASAVLHNVGNVLNSINVSAGVLATRLHKSQAGGLAELSGLVTQHRDDLPGFLSGEGRAEHFAQYLSEVSVHLQSDRQEMLKEVGEMVEGIEHVRRVINAQQAHANAIGVLELVSPVDVMETALELQGGSLLRHEVTIARDYAEATPAPMDRHRVMEILVNLIQNAKQAVAGLAPNSRRITVSVQCDETPGARVVSFGVEDNGEGIRPEHLEKVFAQGFTTRTDGHGFGLHSAANAARAMGGSISAHSEGPGSGARFVLTLRPASGNETRAEEVRGPLPSEQQAQSLRRAS